MNFPSVSRARILTRNCDQLPAITASDFFSRFRRLPPRDGCLTAPFRFCKAAKHMNIGHFWAIIFAGMSNI
jgi:hypothetical protein